MNIIVTGGAGFIGSNFIFHMLKKYISVRFCYRVSQIKLSALLHGG